MTHCMDPEAIRELAARRPGPCVSIYLATPGGREIHQGQVRLEQLLRRVETELAATGVGQSQASDLLTPVHALLAEPWRHGDDRRLAIFAAPGFFRLLRDGFTGIDEAVVGNRFHLRPLLPQLATPARYYVLAISLNHVRLVEATPLGTTRLPLGELEGSFVTAMGYDEFHAELQVHSAGARGGGATRRPAVVHGHGGNDERNLEEDLHHWFRRIAEAVAKRTTDPRALRVLATTTEHASPYLAASRDALLLPDALIGNPDRSSDAELASRARPLVEAALAQQRQEALARWRELLGSERASGELRTVLRLAPQGRVQTLFLPVATELWGTYDASTGALELHVERRPGDEELLERAALETLENGGDVYEVAQLAALDGAPLAAMLRR